MCFVASAKDCEYRNCPRATPNGRATGGAISNAIWNTASITRLLFEKYREHLGGWRYEILRLTQAELAPERVRRLLGLTPPPLLFEAFRVYGLFTRLNLQELVHWLLLPSAYVDEVRKFDRSGAISSERVINNSLRSLRTRRICSCNARLVASPCPELKSKSPFNVVKTPPAPSRIGGIGATS